MKVLVVGGGGREHALLWKLQRDDPALELLAAPGNPGIASLARCIPIPPTDIEAIVALVEAEKIGLTIVGPEAPLAAGLVDRLAAGGHRAFGPTASAARIETSKAFAKDLMLRAGIPTAQASRHVEPASAKRAVHAFGAPVVIKASGLAAGKGVVVCGSTAEAEDVIDSMLLGGAVGAAGSELLVEEFMEGEELSVFAITDGTSVLPMLPAQDHKRLLDGDRGPNTGGMGAYAPVALATRSLMERVAGEILLPTLVALREHGAPFSGLLYAGLMLTASGPKVVEFNCRFGDPETQAIIPLLEGSLLEPLAAVATGSGLSSLASLRWRPGAAATTVLAAEGYPGTARSGDPITLPPAPADVMTFHAGTRRTPGGALVTAGGRVLAITGTGETLQAAREASARYAEAVEFRGKQFRRDIGWREAERHAGAS